MASFRGRLFGILYLGSLCRIGAAALFAAGAVTLALRLAHLADEGFCAAFCGGFLIAALLAALLPARRRLPDGKTALAFLASRVPGGALVLSAEECGGESWPVPEVPGPAQVRLARPGVKTAALSAGVLFCACTIFCPVPEREAERREVKLDLKDETEKIAAQTALLRKQPLDRKEKAAEILKELEEIVRQAESAAPGRSYERLQDLREKLEDELLSGMKEGNGLLRQLSLAEQTARQLGEKTGSSAAAEEQFARLLRNLSAKDPRLAEALKKAGFDGSKMTGEDIRKLADALKGGNEALKRQLENLCRQSGEKCPAPSAGPGAKEELEQFLRENVPGCDELVDSLTNREEGDGGEGGSGDGAPGAGGVSRGRGDAVLELSGNVRDYGAKKVDKALPGQGRGDEKGSRRIGRFATEAEQNEKEARPAKAGHLEVRSGNTGRGEDTVYPAHRRAVRRYFDPGEKRP